jgi:4,5-dihydroxyphthalate decarboxylase
MPSGVKIGLDTSKRNPAEILYAGEADVYLAPRGGAPPIDPQHGPLTTIFRDPIAAQRQYFRETGVFPIIHLITIREEHATPSTVGALCEAFAESKRRGLPRSMADSHETPITGGDPAEVPSLFGDDPWPYGIKRNALVLAHYLADVYAHQHLTNRQLTVEELFPEDLPAAFR